MIVDLHTHTTASDGGLSPLELVRRARERGVQLLAITDHDTVAGFAALKDEAGAGMQLLAGIELSCTWSGVNIHVLGLGIDTMAPAFVNELERQRSARDSRAQLIGQRLDKLGFVGSYEAAATLAAGRAIGRPDFARFLVTEGHVSSMAAAFDKYLGAGKVGDIKAVWPDLGEVVSWIRDAGGVAVMAHPLQYKMTNAKLRRMLAEFKEVGGEGLEVCNGKPSNQDLAYLRQLCQQFELEASAGSDFHHPSSWSELGCDGKIIAPCKAVWDRWCTQ
ncbi:PHP domain-containing protein [Zhongshania sp.]|uniref:PHP domain-containing protein n=1 Tax=Zhongshania sp. TaxID=1971902 RepID=UPI0035691ECA